MRRSARLAAVSATASPAPSPPGAAVKRKTTEKVAARAVRSRVVAEPKTAKAKAVSTAKTKAIITLPREHEEKLWEKGFKFIAGVDEAGRGPLCGPVVAAAVILPRDLVIEGINDSKQTTEAEREKLYDILTTTPGVIWSACVVDEKVIDTINILQATMQAMTGAVNGLSQVPDYVLVDGNRLPPWPHRATSVVKGDSKVHVIAAASIIAKVTRDRLMHEYDKQWPQYQFAQHKGYGTAGHMAAIRKYGPCSIHRLTFAPIGSRLQPGVVKVL